MGCSSLSCLERCQIAGLIEVRCIEFGIAERASGKIGTVPGEIDGDLTLHCAAYQPKKEILEYRHILRELVVRNLIPVLSRILAQQP